VKSVALRRLLVNGLFQLGEVPRAGSQELLLQHDLQNNVIRTLSHDFPPPVLQQLALTIDPSAVGGGPTRGRSLSFPRRVRTSRGPKIRPLLDWEPCGLQLRNALVRRERTALLGHQGTHLGWHQYNGMSTRSSGCLTGGGVPHFPGCTQVVTCRGLDLRSANMKGRNSRGLRMLASGPVSRGRCPRTF
jgi:hypothetical protein